MAIMFMDQRAAGLVVKYASRYLISFAFILSFGISTLAQNQRISLQRENISMEEFLRDVKNLTHLYIFYDPDNLRNAPRLNINVQRVTIDSLFNFVFAGSSLDHHFYEGTTVDIFPREGVEPGRWPVYGKVTGPDGQPLDHATVSVKTSSKKDRLQHAVYADADGCFRIAIPSTIHGNSVVLEVSSVGFSPTEFFVADSTYVHARLEMTAHSMDEVVVLAYGKTTTRFNTGSIDKLDSREIGEQPVGDLASTLEGRLPGLLVSQQNGVAGSAFFTLIRGRSSISQGNLPLFVIDGVPMPPGSPAQSVIPSGTAFGPSGISMLAGLNPADIDNVEVLKDADATAIYGSRAANGAILINTRKAKPGKTMWSASLLAGGSAPVPTTALLNSSAYKTMREEAITNDGHTVSTVNAPDLLLWDPNRYTNYKDMVTGNSSVYQDARVAVNGGDSLISFLLSGDYHHETTPFPGNPGDTRLSGFSNIRYVSPNKRLQISGSGIFSGEDHHLPVNDPTRFMYLAPDAPAPFDSTGQPVWQQDGLHFLNIPAQQLNTYTVHGQDLFTHGELSYKIFRWLDARASLGYHSMVTRETSLEPMAAEDPAYNPSGSYFQGSTNLNGLIAEPQLEYHGCRHHDRWSILVGSTWESEHTHQETVTATGYMNDSDLGMLDKAPSVITQNNNVLYLYEAMFASARVNLQDRYIISLSGRRDGSSRFGPGRQFGDFWSAGAAWLFRQEHWFPDWSVMSFGKLRGSYGVTGNDQIGDYQYAQGWSISRSPYDSVQGLFPVNPGNPMLGWEVIKKLEGAIELGFFQDRIWLSAAWFRHWSTNQLLTNLLPSQTGYYSVLSNVPVRVENTGWEFLMRVQSVSLGKVSWSPSFSLTIPKNRLASFPGLASSSDSNSLFLGKSITTINAYQYIGVDPATGIFKFRDLNGDNKIDGHDLAAGGNNDVIAYGGWNNSFAWKGFQLTVFIEARKQQGQNALAQLYKYYKPGMLTSGVLTNEPVTVLNRWQKPGDHALLQRYTDSVGSPADAASNLFIGSTAQLTDASFIRIKTVELSYSLPVEKLGKRLKSCRFYLQGQNLWRLTSYQITDPETQSIFSLPPLRTLVAGVSISF